MPPKPDQVQIGDYVKIRVKTGENPGDPNAVPPIPPSPIFTELYGLRDNSPTDERAAIDASHKNTPHDITIPGPRTGSIDMTLVANRVDVTAAEEATQSALEAIYEAGTSVEFEEVSSYPGAPADGSGDVVKRASGVILTFSKAAPRGDVVTISATLTLNEALTVVA